MDDLISRQVAINKINERQRKLIYCFGFENDMVKIMDIAKSIIVAVPSAQPELIEKAAYIRGFEQGRTQGRIDAQGGKKMNKQRKVVITITYNEMGIIIDTKAEEVAQPDRDIPKKPGETTDRSWGIPHRQAVCPNCDCYLVDVYFIDGSKRKVTYCESCGQAIDWEGWEEDE